MISPRKRLSSETATTNTALSNVTFSAEKEVEAAVRGQRALAAFLATGFETQRIQNFDEKNQAHQVELPSSALRLLVDILSEFSRSNAVRVVVITALDPVRARPLSRVPIDSGCGFETRIGCRFAGYRLRESGLTSTSPGNIPEGRPVP